MNLAGFRQEQFVKVLRYLVVISLPQNHVAQREALSLAFERDNALQVLSP